MKKHNKTRKYNKSRKLKKNRKLNKIIYKGGNNPVTVVSAYYSIKSKRSKEEYIERIKRFWSYIPCNLIFFTDKEHTPFIEDVRKEFKDITKVITLEFEEFEALKKHPRSFWEKQHGINLEKYHTPDLYMVWFEKKEFVLKSIKLNPFNSEYFVWCDAGISYPNTELERDINKFKDFPISSKIPNDKMLLLKLKDFSDINLESNFRSIPESIAGNIFAGQKNTWEKYSKEYDEMVKYFIDNNKFIGMDQSIMASMYIKNSSLFKVIERKPVVDNKIYI